MLTQIKVTAFGFAKISWIWNSARDVSATDIDWIELQMPGRSRMPRTGVYFLANDSIYDLAVAFLKSFRIHNPAAALCLIPYDDQISRLSRLASQYNFFCLSDATLLARCDAISRQIHGETFGHY